MKPLKQKQAEAHERTINHGKLSIVEKIRKVATRRGESKRELLRLQIQQAKEAKWRRHFIHIPSAVQRITESTGAMKGWNSGGNLFVSNSTMKVWPNLIWSSGTLESPIADTQLNTSIAGITTKELWCHSGLAGKSLLDRLGGDGASLFQLKQQKHETLHSCPLQHSLNHYRRHGCLVSHCHHDLGHPPRSWAWRRSRHS